jgi:IS1 family transposase
MNKLPPEKRAQLIGMMVEGMSIRAIVRLTGVSKNTVAKLLVDAGRACAEYQDRALCNLRCRRLQLDEIWSFVYSKQANVPVGKQGSAGDVWTWTAIDAETKLIPTWYIGRRDGEAALAFVTDLASRLANRVQITSDGHRAYLNAVEEAFGTDADYAMLVKLYGEPAQTTPERKYSPAECTGTRTVAIAGNPDPAHISTSYAERANLTMRMHMRRFTRLTNAFSKKVENHAHAVALNFMYYNFVRIHSSVRMTPAMAAGVTSKLWELADIVRVIDDWEATQKLT